ncbi:MAG: hypothetical protein A3B86_00355 [Candidatus Yanofskybacteria bacterium RIFCSPHIGHO2_02_FULL_38_22b]|uniref:Uncharacterized protein n=1 Tax=Candidatus Yanofskybacteria bacterium RIFCSPHIGHO2_02_FULL_38_22b TaxID=1802673 RepID=A0A1F8F0H3_9BACT|nr:MAG: hypothetical protein A3B86_00355 [Candidatus Yanofskybacteria bacterium RIFCSPHIGHO2_02_FULL_38_22b]OGN20562.1 MAG: hypothetical protein A2910_01740 [Candidatus Yanofskybacteria bacterium RIFCSPLOWO2_01_FULL_39_28]
MEKQSSYFLNGIIFILLFGLLAVFLVHNFDSIGQDIGRHLKVGEIIWQIKEVPKTNLFSYTEPDFSFTNHHWLSEVIFLGVYNLAGFTGLILLKVFVILASFLLLFFIAKKQATFWPITISFILSILIFISRTEVRPEIFSFAILSFFLFALFKSKHENTDYYLWFLPLAQLLWVNLHIYFFIGPLIFLFFLIDKKINSKSQTLNSKQYQNSNYQKSKPFFILFLIILATLANPAGFQGALLPFNILKEYGYSIIENQTLAFLSGFFGFNLSVFIFKLSVAVLALAFLLTVKKAKQRLFEILVSAFFIYAGFKMFRNLPLYALASFPVLAILLTDAFKKTKTSVRAERVNYGFKLGVIVFLIFMILFVASNSYYKKEGHSKIFGFSVPNGLKRAVNFIKDNKIKGPMFNNFDTGGYLMWQLPEEKVFVDNRPEAYSVEFFNKTYKPMQESKEKWAEFSEKYGINLIFFAYTDATPWGEAFLGNITHDPNWRIVYINENVIILVKNIKSNEKIISNFAISETDVIDKTIENVKNSNSDKFNLNITLSLLFYKISWREAAVYFADEAIKLDPQAPRPYLYKGFVYAYHTDMENQKLADENIRKAIDSGLKDSQYYYILGVINMNLGHLDEARTLFIKALEIDKNNQQAREFLNKYFK